MFIWLNEENFFVTKIFTNLASYEVNADFHKTGLNVFITHHFSGLNSSPSPLQTYPPVIQAKHLFWWWSVTRRPGRSVWAGPGGDPPFLAAVSACRFLLSSSSTLKKRQKRMCEFCVKLLSPPLELEFPTTACNQNEARRVFWARWQVLQFVPRWNNISDLFRGGKKILQQFESCTRTTAHVVPWPVNGERLSPVFDCSEKDKAES